MKYLSLMVICLLSLQVSHANESKDFLNLIENCFNEGMQEVVYNDKEITEDGERYNVDTGFFRCEVYSEEQKNSSFKYNEGSCNVSFKAKNGLVKVTNVFSYKYLASTAEVDDPSIFDDGLSCLLEAKEI